VLARANSWLDRRPTAGDAVLAVLLLGFSLSTLTAGESNAGVAGVVFSVLLTAPLVLRRRAPVAVFAVVMLVCGAELLFVEEFIAANAAALVALYTLVVYAPRRLAAIGFAVTLAGAAPYAALFDNPSTGDALVTWLLLAGQIVLAAALGDRTRARLGDRARLEERARLLAAERDQQATIAAAAERARIARELHDVVAHSLSVVIAQADGGRYAAGRDPGQARAALDTIATTAREAQAEMRRALGILREQPGAPFRPQPGAGDLPALVARTREAGLAVELTEEGAARELPPAAGVTLYRVVQEALTNVLKHAGPDATSTVTLRWEPDRVTVVVRDDGSGAGASEDGRGAGLAGMRERVEPRGGTLSAGPHPDGGFEVRAELPTAATPAASGTRA
jgi:signal transduction histidine kinase